ncbi:MAG: hypothetical protein ACLQVK_17975 [Acidimicrobiales bacterium]
MRRFGKMVGAVLVLLGVFWSGRESSHGLTALWEHWWCPLPLALVVVGAAVVVTARRRTSTV